MSDRPIHIRLLKNTVTMILVLFALLLITGCDIVGTPEPLPPTATVTQTEVPTPTIDWFPATATSTPQVTPSPTPRPTPADLRQGITDQLVDDDFTDERMWSTTQGNSGNVVFGIENLTIAVARENTTLTSLSQHTVPANYYLEVTLQTSLCQPADQMGLLFWRQSDSDFYRLLFNCTGQYRLEVVQGGSSIVLQDWESGVSSQPGSPAMNRLGLWVNRGSFQLYINDTFQFERQIARDQNGGLGVFARTIASSAMTVRFADLQIYRVESD